MTIKARNRFYLGFFSFSLIVLVLNLIILNFMRLTGSIVFPDVSTNFFNNSSFLFSYKPLFTILGIFFELFYLCIVSMTILYAFYKTQASELAYFLIFLLSILMDSLRIYIPLFQLANTYTTALITVSNIIFAGSILGPVSLLCLVLLSDENQRQNLEQNCAIIIIASAFIAFVIPLNTGKLLPNYSLVCAFNNVIRISISIMMLVAVFSLLLNNLKNELSQLMTLGFFILALGTLILRHCYSLIQLILGAVFISLGTLFYLKELHNKFLWNR